MQSYLISYDISDNRLRLMAARHILRAGAYRVQYSVFLGTFRAVSHGKLLTALQRITLEPRWRDSDTILVLPLHQYSKDELTLFGKTPENWSLMTGNLHTLVL